MSEQNISAEGVLRITRVQGDRVLFNSPFRHNQFISLIIFPARIDRSLNRTQVYPDQSRPLIKVSLSASQFAQAITTLNIGEGTPCTVDYVLDKEINPILKIEDEKYIAESEIDETSQELLKNLNEMKSILSDTKLSNKARATLESQISKLERVLEDKLPFITKMYKEYLEKASQQAKTEFSAWVEMQGYNKPKMIEGE